MRRPIIVTLVLIAFVGTLATVAPVTAATTVPTQVPATARTRPIATVAGAGGSNQSSGRVRGGYPQREQRCPSGSPGNHPQSGSKFAFGSRVCGE